MKNYNRYIALIAAVLCFIISAMAAKDVCAAMFVACIIMLIGLANN